MFTNGVECCIFPNLYSSVLVVFNNFLIIDATDRSKISSDQKGFFIALCLHTLSFFIVLLKIYLSSFSPTLQIKPPKHTQLLGNKGFSQGCSNIAKPVITIFLSKSPDQIRKFLNGILKSFVVNYRILLQCLEAHATRYGRYIQPLLSLSIDFYARVFVRVS